MIAIRRLAWAQLLTCFWGLGAGTLLAQKPGDLNGNGTVSWHDLSEVEWTGDIHDGSGTSTPEDGDLDGDRDVDGMDLLRLWELREEGPSCHPLTTARVKLIYDAATGNVSTDAVGADCYADMFVLESNEGLFHPLRLISDQGYLVFEPQSKHQVSGI